MQQEKLSLCIFSNTLNVKYLFYKLVQKDVEKISCFTRELGVDAGRNRVEPRNSGKVS